MNTYIRMPVNIPVVPNYVTLEQKDAEGEPVAVDIADLDEEELADIGRIWTRDLIAHAEARRDARDV